MGKTYIWGTAELTVRGHTWTESLISTTGVFDTLLSLV